MATATEYPVRVDEFNGLLHAYCPTCSKMYPVEDIDGNAVEMPAKCQRCGGPMDWEKAKAFGQRRAEEEAGMAASAPVGGRSATGQFLRRGMTGPDRDTAMHESETKRR